MERHFSKRAALSGLVFWGFAQLGAAPALAAGSAPVTVKNDATNPVPVRLESGASVGIEPGSDPVPVEVQADFFESDAVPTREVVVGEYIISQAVIDCPVEGTPPDDVHVCPLSVEPPNGQFGISGGRILTIAVQDHTQDPDVQGAVFLRVSGARSAELYLGRLERTGLEFPYRALTREVNLPDDSPDGATFMPYVRYVERPAAHQVSVVFVRVEERGRLAP